MRNATTVSSFLLAACLAAPIFFASNLVTPSLAASEHGNAPTPVKERIAQPHKPTWDQCFEMSTTRGFNHDTEEWQQSIQDCMAGKISL